MKNIFKSFFLCDNLRWNIFIPNNDGIILQKVPTILNSILNRFKILLHCKFSKNWLQATQILIDTINCVARNHKSWTQEQQSKGGISGYNAGCGNVQVYFKATDKSRIWHSMARSPGWMLYLFGYKSSRQATLPSTHYSWLTSVWKKLTCHWYSRGFRVHPKMCSFTKYGSNFNVVTWILK